MHICGGSRAMVEKVDFDAEKMPLGEVELFALKRQATLTKKFIFAVNQRAKSAVVRGGILILRDILPGHHKKGYAVTDLYFRTPKSILV